MNKDQFVGFVRDTLTKNNDWASDLLTVLADRINHTEALMLASLVTTRTVNEAMARVNAKDAAMRSALGLLDAKRMNDSLRDELVLGIIPGVQIGASCELENRVIEKAAKIIQARKEN